MRFTSARWNCKKFLYEPLPVKQTDDTRGTSGGWGFDRNVAGSSGLPKILNKHQELKVTRMTPEDVLRVLRKSNAPDRKIDKRIAPFAGFQRLTQSSESGPETISFTDYRGVEIKVPAFTRDLDAAHQLIGTMFPGRAVAVTWEPGEAYRAQIDGAAAVEASDPALALCIAAFSALVEGGAKV
jgi:hypothetical protein